MFEEEEAEAEEVRHLNHKPFFQEKDHKINFLVKNRQNFFSCFVFCCCLPYRAKKERKKGKKEHRLRLSIR